MLYVVEVGWRNFVCNVRGKMGVSWEGVTLQAKSWGESDNSADLEEG